MSNRKKGFTLIEIVLAIALLLIAMGGIAAVIIGTKNSSEKLFTEGDLQQQLVEVQDSLQDEILATNVGLKYWVKSGDTWVHPNSKTEQENTSKLFAIYNVDYIDYVLKKQYMYYDSSEKKLYYGDASESLDMSKTKPYELDVDPNAQEVIDSLNDKWTVSSLKVKTFEIDSFVFGKKKLLPYRIAIEQDGVEYKASDTVNIRNEIKVNERMVIDPAQTAKITKPVLENTSFDYNGQEQGPEEKYFNSRYVRRVGSTLKAKDAGVYQVTYQLTQKNARWADGSKDDITYIWEIKPIELTLTWGTTSWTYDTQIHSTEVSFDQSVVVPGEDLVITLNDNSVGPNVGQTMVTAVPSSNNYKIKQDENAQQIIKIEPATASWETEIQPKNYVYDGAEHVLTTTSYTIGGTAMYRLIRYTDSNNNVMMSDQDWNTTPYAGSEAGSYTIECKINIEDSLNYVESETKTVTAIISKADPVLTEPVINTGLVYTGAKQKLFNIPPTAPSSLTVKYSKNGNIYTTSQPREANAGTYTVKYKTEANNNYNASEEKTVQVTIGKANPSYRERPQEKHLTYNGDQQMLVTSGSTNDGTIEYYVNGVWWGPAIPKKTNAGTYEVKYKIKGDRNHNDSPLETLSVTINKAPGVSPKTAPQARDLNYNASEQALVTEGEAQVGTLKYLLGGTNSWSQNVPRQKNVGTYIVYYKVEGDSNHYDTDPVAIEVTIKALDIYIQEPPTTYITYDGSPHSAPRLLRTDPGDCTIKYGKQAGVYNSTSPRKETNAGTYTIYYSVSRTGCTTRTGSYQLVIEKASPTFSRLPSAKQNLIYNGQEQQLINAGITTVPGGTIVYSEYTNIGFKPEIPTGKKAQGYTIYYKVIGNNNYLSNVVGSIHINIKDSVLIGDVNFDGKVDDTDHTLIQDYQAQMITFTNRQEFAADADGDGTITVLDATAIQKYVSGLSSNPRIGTWVIY